ncbi:MAG: hypothetical protein QOK42_298 [Frankiaceae bacterium]|nr:hypothetical protein [Frankiaceae bacterium]MDX6225409.1 hypothetical protein [Frankiales bacterium]MDX6274572.1 hypothetical protein [Frankiales bacterium]
MEGVAGLVELLSRRGTLEVIGALEGPSLTSRALERRLHPLSPSVVAQRVHELRDLGAVEVVPENDELRLSGKGRRLQGELARLARWLEG